MLVWHKGGTREHFSTAAVQRSSGCYNRKCITNELVFVGKFNIHITYFGGKYFTEEKGLLIVYRIYIMYVVCYAIVCPYIE